ncbi:MAG: hypothetical protein BHW09_05825 [Clostridium sp. CAG:245_30_32]|nr:MAG: hypothetical protein BHW09_05825 [Clostridium sp. CAG:245_30_32]
MKAEVITLHSVCNYGTQLQAFATQEKLKEYFDEVEFINYKRSNTYGIGLLKTFTKGNILKAPFILPTLIRWKYVFGRFQKKYLNLTSKEYLNMEDFRNFEVSADVYFSGSDQVWNTGWNKGVIPPLYLSFVPDDKPKYAYASSFGKSKLEEDELEEIKKYLSRYNRISVREDSGLKILKEQLNIDNAIRILDPTLIENADFWRKYAPKNKIKGDYILIYNLNRSKEFDEYAKKLSEKTGYKLYRFCTRIDQMVRNGKSLIIPEIFEFISLVDNAKIVLTDSFHATAFSINMNTEPICIYPNEYSTRISDFLKLVDCTDRHAKDYSDFDVIDRHIDFDNVNKILNKEREKAEKYLKQVAIEVKKVSNEN